MKKKRNNRKSCLPWLIFFIVSLGIVSLMVFVPESARQSFGAPSPDLNAWQKTMLGFELIWNADKLVQPGDLNGSEQSFTIEPGESVDSVSVRLEQAGLIRSAGLFKTYLIWTGMDVYIQPGTFRLSPAQTARDIAITLESTTLTEIKFNVLPGWRMEEIAAAIPTSGFRFSTDEFKREINVPRSPPDFLPIGGSAEGFLAPGEYILPRATTASELIASMLERFSTELTPGLRAGFADQGLTVYQAVTLASIIQREAIMESEMPLIASVFFNRLNVDMPLQSDPTVQYSLGYNSLQGTWWTNPLSAMDLNVDSPYNTYLFHNLPPGPISEPGTAALEAVADPSRSSYYFFQAKCDGSGYHNFSETFEQHQQNNCP
jgi:UPF0755 protein